MHDHMNSHCIVDGRIEFSTTRAKYLILSLFSTECFEKKQLRNQTTIHVKRKNAI